MRRLIRVAMKARLSPAARVGRLACCAAAVIIPIACARSSDGDAVPASGARSGVTTGGTTGATTGGTTGTLTALLPGSDPAGLLAALGASPFNLNPGGAAKCRYSTGYNVAPPLGQVLPGYDYANGSYVVDVGFGGIAALPYANKSFTMGTGIFDSRNESILDTLPSPIASSPQNRFTLYTGSGTVDFVSSVLKADGSTAYWLSDDSPGPPTNRVLTKQSSTIAITDGTGVRTVYTLVGPTKNSAWESISPSANRFVIAEIWHDNVRAKKYERDEHYRVIAERNSADEIVEKIDYAGPDNQPGTANGFIENITYYKNGTLQRTAQFTYNGSILDTISQDTPRLSRRLGWASAGPNGAVLNWYADNGFLVTEVQYERTGRAFLVYSGLTRTGAQLDCHRAQDAELASTFGAAYGDIKSSRVQVGSGGTSAGTAGSAPIGQGAEGTAIGGFVGAYSQDVVTVMPFKLMAGERTVQKGSAPLVFAMTDNQARAEGGLILMGAGADFLYTNAFSTAKVSCNQSWQYPVLLARKSYRSTTAFADTVLGYTGVNCGAALDALPIFGGLSANANADRSTPMGAINSLAFGVQYDLKTRSVAMGPESVVMTEDWDFQKNIHAPTGGHTSVPSSAAASGTFTYSVGAAFSPVAALSQDPTTVGWLPPDYLSDTDPSGLTVCRGYTRTATSKTELEYLQAPGGTCSGPPASGAHSRTCTGSVGATGSLAITDCKETDENGVVTEDTFLPNGSPQREVVAGVTEEDDEIRGANADVYTDSFGKTLTTTNLASAVQKFTSPNGHTSEHDYNREPSTDPNVLNRSTLTVRMNGTQTSQTVVTRDPTTTTVRVNAGDILETTVTSNRGPVPVP